MSSDEIHPTALPSGGFVGAGHVKVYDDIAAAQDAWAASLPIEVTKPDTEAREAGVVVHFRYDGGEYELMGDVSRGEVGLVVTRSEIRAAPPSGVTTRLQRTAPIAEVLNAVRAYEALEEARRRGTRVVLGEEPAPGLFTAPAAEIPETSGRTAITDDLLRAVATAYMQETAPGKDRRAIRFDRPEGTVRTWISRARKDGWLGPGAKGRMGGEPGPKLIGWLREAMADPEIQRKDDAELSEAFALTTGPTKAALRAYDDISERDISHHMGLAPKLASFAAQARFGRPLSAELAERTARLNGDEDTAREEMAMELRQEIADRGITTEPGR
jgi:hypothetical protein